MNARALVLALSLCSLTSAPALALGDLTGTWQGTLKCASSAIGGVVNGVEFSDPKFHPVWAKAEELGVPLFIHPQGVPEVSKRLAGNGWLGNTIGNPLETTIALSHLIFEGTLDRFPGLKICAAHGGGFLPSYANRSDAVIRCFPNRVGPLPKKPPTAYLRDGQLFFDTIVFTPEALRHLIAETGASQIVIGTDFGFPIAVHPDDPDTVYVVPLEPMTRTCPGGQPAVWRSENAGDKWTKLAKGLPKKEAWFTVLRDAMDIDGGRRPSVWFGTTCGQLWRGRDGGDSFECVINALPPIYCVKAAVV